MSLKQSAFLFTELACAIVWSGDEGCSVTVFKTPDDFRLYASGQKQIEQVQSFSLPPMFTLQDITDGTAALFIDTTYGYMWGNHVR